MFNEFIYLFIYLRVFRSISIHFLKEKKRLEMHICLKEWKKKRFWYFCFQRISMPEYADADAGMQMHFIGLSMQPHTHHLLLDHK